MKPPKNSGELRTDKDHILINLGGKWKVQKTVRPCSRKSCWELLTHPQYSKIHILQRCEKINKQGSTVFYQWENSEWQVKECPL